MFVIGCAAVVITGCGSSRPAESAHSTITKSSAQTAPATTASQTVSNADSSTPTSTTQAPSANDFEARWMHSISGYTDIETVDVLGNKFRLSTKCISGSSCKSITEILSGTTVIVCAGSPSHCHRATTSSPVTLGSQNPYRNLPGITYIKSLFHDLTPEGSGQALGMPTTCGRGISSIGAPHVMHYCLLDATRVLASFDEPSEHWKLLSIVGRVSPSRFAAP
jgi:hypothetical protein